MVNLDARLTVPMTTRDKARLRRKAADLGVSPGVLARAFILRGLKSLNDPQLVAQIEAEAEAATERASAAGKAAMKARWSKEQARNKRGDPGNGNVRQD